MKCLTWVKLSHDDRIATGRCRAFHRRLWAAWEGIGLEGQRAMIRARYRPQVRVGGRGVGRITANPINPTTVGQPLPA